MNPKTNAEFEKYTNTALQSTAAAPQHSVPNLLLIQYLIYYTKLQRYLGTQEASTNGEYNSLSFSRGKKRKKTSQACNVAIKSVQKDSRQGAT
jgi:hypothetical protein